MRRTRSKRRARHCFRKSLLPRFAQAYSANLLLFGCFTLLGPLIASALPFRAEELLWNPWQPLWLVATYLVLAIAFFCAANAIGLTLMAHRRGAGRIGVARRPGGRWS
jgi:succinate dehydrogenase hydrophobic anchor subunit